MHEEQLSPYAILGSVEREYKVAYSRRHIIYILQILFFISDESQLALWLGMLALKTPTWSVYFNS